MRNPVTIIGGGLAGTEAAWQLAERGIPARLFEMRPSAPTPAHRTGDLAELVCSNSLKSEQPQSAPWLLKQELRRLGSLLLRVAAECAVPGGQALVVDRERFAAGITAAISGHPLIELRREQVTDLPRQGIVIVASGPLTSDSLAASIQQATGSNRLFFYDSISPIVDAETVDRQRAFPASRYGKGGEDYWNCPFNREEYDRFYDALVGAESYPLHEFEDGRFFEACLPIEELARRGRDTLRFGPMKPVGLTDPRTGHRPWAVVQLRAENLRVDSFNLVGFQNHLRFGEQARILHLIPGLENATFLRYGQIHRNTYINAPELLDERLALRALPDVFFAGQISGVEGYVESIATGLLAGIAAAAAAAGEPYAPPARVTALGSLVNYVTKSDPKHYQPANITFDLLPPLEHTERDRVRRRTEQCRLALEAIDNFVTQAFRPVLLD
jgi:methylenetetrahydrofolate--tRNA-(uracil-5-)-methyltransferase